MLPRDLRERGCDRSSPDFISRQIALSPGHATNALIKGARRVTVSFAAPAGKNAAMEKVAVVEAEPVEGQPAKQRVELRKDPAPAPRHARERPARADMDEIGEVGLEGFE